MHFHFPWMMVLVWKLVYNGCFPMVSSLGAPSWHGSRNLKLIPWSQKKNNCVTDFTYCVKTVSPVFFLMCLDETDWYKLQMKFQPCLGLVPYLLLYHLNCLIKLITYQYNSADLSWFPQQWWLCPWSMFSWWPFYPQQHHSVVVWGLYGLWVCCPLVSKYRCIHQK